MGSLPGQRNRKARGRSDRSFTEPPGVVDVRSDVLATSECIDQASPPSLALEKTKAKQNCAYHRLLVDPFLISGTLLVVCLLTGKRNSKATLERNKKQQENRQEVEKKIS